MLSGPGVDLAATGLREGGQAFEQIDFQQAKNRLGADAAIGLGGCCHGQVCVLFQQGMQQAFGQVQRKERGVAWHREQQRCIAMRQAREETRQRACVTAQAVGPDLRAKRRVGSQVAVGIDQHAVGWSALLLQSHQGLLGQRQAPEVLQPFVDPTHARATATREDEGGDGRCWAAVVHGLNHRCSSFRPV